MCQIKQASIMHAEYKFSDGQNFSWTCCSSFDFSDAVALCASVLVLLGLNYCLHCNIISQLTLSFTHRTFTLNCSFLAALHVVKSFLVFRVAFGNVPKVAEVQKPCWHFLLCPFGSIARRWPLWTAKPRVIEFCNFRELAQRAATIKQETAQCEVY